MADAITLYDSHGSPCARRVRAVLLEKGLAWATRLVDLTRMEQKRPGYLALNPNGVVPTLVYGDRVLYESNVITEYLDDVFPEPPLYPRDPWACARAKMWQAFELAMAKEFRPLMYADGEAGHRESLLRQRLDRLEGALVGHDWLVGDQYSIADLSV